MSKGKVLVVMSSANALDLKDGKTYSTGYYLNEFVVPYRKLIEAGFEPVIANPKGDRPVMDVNSNNAMFFGGDDAARADALTTERSARSPARAWSPTPTVSSSGSGSLTSCKTSPRERRR